MGFLWHVQNVQLSSASIDSPPGCCSPASPSAAAWYETASVILILWQTTQTHKQKNIKTTAQESMFIGDQQSRLFSWLFYISKPCLTRITTRLTSVIFIQDERMLLFIIQLLRVEPSKWQNKCTAILYSYLQSRQPVYRTYGSLCTSKTVTLSLFHWWIYWLQHLDNKFLIRCFCVWYRFIISLFVCFLALWPCQNTAQLLEIHGDTSTTHQKI